MKLKLILTTAIVGMVASLLGAAAPAQADPFAYVPNSGGRRQRLPVRHRRGRAAGAIVPGHRRHRRPLPRGGGEPGRPSVYVANSGNDSVSQYDIGAGGLLAPLSPATVATGAAPFGVAVSPDGGSVYVANFRRWQRLPVRRRRGRGALAEEPGHGGHRHRPRGGGEPGRGERLRHQLDERQRLPVRRRRRRGALAEEPGHGGHRRRPVRGGGEPGRGERLRRQLHRAHTVSQYDVGAGGALSPKSPATVATGAGPRGVAVSPDGRSVYVANSGSDSVSQYDVGAGGALSPKSPATVATGGDPRGVAVSPDGGSAYVANFIERQPSPSTTSARAGRSRPRARPRWPPATARSGWR